MERITNIQNIKDNEEITKTIMTISDGRNEKQAEVYLAFLNGETDRRYIVYTTELNRGKDEKATFNLATMTFRNGEYVLEATSNEDHQNVELKVLNIVGLSGDKGQEEVEEMIKKEFPTASTLDLEALKRNIDQMSISVENPPKKANMPMIIADVIKRYYIRALNKELKKIHKNKEMTQEEINTSSNKLDKIENKLDELQDTYYQYPDNDKYNDAVEISLSEIKQAKEDIMEAKRSLEFKQAQLDESELNKENPNSLGEEQGIELNPELPEANVEESIVNGDEHQNVETTELSNAMNGFELEKENPDTLNEEQKLDLNPEVTSLDNENVKIENNNSNEVVEQEKKNEEINSSIPPVEVNANNSLNMESKLNSIVREDEIQEMDEFAKSFNQEEIDNKKQKIVDDSVSKFGQSVETIVQDITIGISALYENQIQAKENESNLLKTKIQSYKNENNGLKAQVQSYENEKSELSVMVENVKNKALEASKQAENSKLEINDLTTKNTGLEKENVELKSTVESQKQLLDQQNSNMETLREEGKTRETSLLQEIESLKQEVSMLKGYKDAYNQIASLLKNQIGTEQKIDTEQNGMKK